MSVQLGPELSASGKQVRPRFVAYIKFRLFQSLRRHVPLYPPSLPTLLFHHPSLFKTLFPAVNFRSSLKSLCLEGAVSL